MYGFEAWHIIHNHGYAQNVHYSDVKREDGYAMHLRELAVHE